MEVNLYTPKTIPTTQRLSHNGNCKKYRYGKKIEYKFAKFVSGKFHQKALTNILYNEREFWPSSEKHCRSVCLQKSCGQGSNF